MTIESLIASLKAAVPDVPAVQSRNYAVRRRNATERRAVPHDARAAAQGTSGTARASQTFQREPAQTLAWTRGTAGTAASGTDRSQEQTPSMPPASLPWCWQHGDAWNEAEIALFWRRVELFKRRGLDDPEVLAEQLLHRDRDGDERRMCTECAQLDGAPGHWRCCGGAYIGGGEMLTKLQRAPTFVDACRACHAEGANDARVTGSGKAQGNVTTATPVDLTPEKTE